MTNKEQLWFLINGLLDRSYSMEIFCNEFTRIYDLEVNYDELSDAENKAFYELCSMTGRFSDYDEDLKIPHAFYTGEEIFQKVKELKTKLQ